MDSRSRLFDVHRREDLPTGKRQRYTRKFKIQAVQTVTEPGVSVREVKEDLGVHALVLRKWKNQLAQHAEQPFCWLLLRMHDAHRRLVRSSERASTADGTASPIG